VALETAEIARNVALEASCPHRTMKPVLGHDGLQWTAGYGWDASGERLVVGRGETPMEAMHSFNRKWWGSEMDEVEGKGNNE